MLHFLVYDIRQQFLV